MQAGSLVLKIALTLVSVVAYAVIAQLAESLESVPGIPEAGLWFHQVIGVVFGALVLALYIGSRRRVIRFLAMCAASATIYYLAVRFVTDGPLGYDAITSFIMAGSGAAMLSGLAVCLIGPRDFAWRLVPLMLGAGALGGAAFDFKLAFDPYLLIGHAAWQLLVCLALHFTFRDAPT